MKLDTPKKVINYYRYLEYNNLAVCDGMTEPMGIFDILYPLFIISGLSFFAIVLVHWEEIKK